jgi:hypothetical protein
MLKVVVVSILGTVALVGSANAATNAECKAKVMAQSGMAPSGKCSGQCAAAVRKCVAESKPQRTGTPGPKDKPSSY